MGRCCYILNTIANIFKWLPVVIILGAVSWGYYAYVYELCIRNIESNVQRIFYLIIFHILLILFLVSYYKTIFTPIGKPPSSFFLPTEMAEEMDTSKMDGTKYNIILRRFVEQNRLQLMTRAFDGGFRYCDICKCIKPDRAHHCSMCGQCVLKFDHHCPWVNTCVNFHNYKFFLLFLGYGFLFCIFVAFTDLPYFIRFWGAFGENRFVLPPGGYHIVLLVFVAGMFAISLSCLFFYHLYLTARNRSTVESFRAPLLEGGPDKNAFNHGIRANYREIFGRDRRLWFLPVFSSCGCGSVYRVRGVDAAYERQNHVEHAQVRNQLTSNPNDTYPSTSPTPNRSTSSSLSASAMA